MRNMLAVLALFAVCWPLPAFAQSPDPSDVATVLDAFTVGGGVALGLATGGAMLVYRKRRAILAIDTWVEVRALLAFLLPIGLAAWVAIPDTVAPAKRAGAAVVIAFFTALKMNSGPLGTGDGAKPPVALLVLFLAVSACGCRGGSPKDPQAVLEQGCESALTGAALVSLVACTRAYERASSRAEVAALDRACEPLAAMSTELEREETIALLCGA